MLEIRTDKIKDTAVTVPGSKSYTHRLLIAAALSDGVCRIENMLKSEDTGLTLAALEKMGVVTEQNGGILSVSGTAGILKACSEPIYLGNSGTSMRLLAGVAGLADGKTVLCGTDRMHERPIQDLIDALNQLGIEASSAQGNGCPPVEIQGGTVPGGSVTINCSISSQYLSSLLLIAPYTERGLDISVSHGPVSKPYIDMTVDIMEKLGISVMRKGYEYYSIPGSQVYRCGSYMVEPDCSQAGYFWAAAAVTGKTIKVLGVSRSTRQGDVRFAEVLEKMGCSVRHEPDGISVTGGPLRAVEVDMSDMPDIVPTLAVVAAFAKGVTKITNVAHLKAKESDRIGAVVSELCKLKINATAEDAGLRVEGGNPQGAEIETYNDHRMAMCFAVAGLRVPGVVIRNERCVEKSFPNFWEVLDTLYR